MHNCYILADQNTLYYHNNKTTVHQTFEDAATADIVDEDGNTAMIDFFSVASFTDATDCDCDLTPATVDFSDMTEDFGAPTVRLPLLTI